MNKKILLEMLEAIQDVDGLKCPVILIAPNKRTAMATFESGCPLGWERCHCKGKRPLVRIESSEMREKRRQGLLDGED